MSSLCQTITSAITQFCLSQLGGLYEVYIASFDSVSGGSATISASNVVTSLTMLSGAKFQRFTTNLKNRMAVEENPVANAENGSLYWLQKLIFSINQRNTNNRNAVAQVSGQRTMAIVKEKATSTFWIIGLNSGLYIDNSTKGSSGLKPEDGSRWDLVLTAEESDPAYEITAAAVSTVIV
jgi:hypothetical protein